MDTEDIERKITKILTLYDEGKTLGEIRAALGPADADAERIYGILSLLAREKDVLPSRELLTRALGDSAGVTNPSHASYTERRGAGGRPSIENYEAADSFIRMMNKWKVIIPVGVVALLVIVFLAGGFGDQATSLSLRESDLESERSVFDGLDAELDATLGIEGMTDAVDTELDAAENGSGATPVSGTSAADLSALQAELTQESKTVELDKNFDAFFAEEAAIEQDVNGSLDL